MSHNAAFFIAAQAGVTPLAVGMPGCAKSASMLAFARATNRRIYTLIGSLRDPADIGGYPHPDGHNGATCMKLVPPEWAAHCCNGEPWIVFLDELTTVVPAVQAAMLRVIAERVVGDLVLPDNTWLVAAANPPDVAANGQELEPPMANRICHLKWDMDWEAFDSGLMNGLKFPATSFPVLPDNWQDQIGAIGSLVAAFRKRKPGLFDAFPKEDRSKASGAWPSPRSWTNAVRCLAAAESVNADDGIKHQLVEGCVGYAAAIEFSEWRRNLDLPDPEEMIEEALAARKAKRPMKYKHPDRPDKLIALLGSVSHAVISQGNTVERWEAGMAIIEAAAKHEVDVAMSCAKMLASNVPKGASASAELVHNLFPIIKRALCD